MTNTGADNWADAGLQYVNLPPSVPSSLTATPQSLQVLLKWNKNAEQDFLRYRIYGGTSAIPTTLIDSTTGGISDTTITIDQLTNYQIYYFHITAVDSAGLESGFSNEVPAIPGDYIRPIVHILSPGEGFSIPEYDLLTVSWTASDNIAMDSIQIIYSNEADGAQQVMGKVPADSSQFIFNVPAGITDQAQVHLHGWDTSGNDTLVHSPYFTVTDNTPPDSVVIDSIANCYTARSYEITWRSIDNSGSFRSHHIFASNGDSAFTLIDSVSGSEFSYDWQVPNVLSNNYRLKVTSFDNVGLSRSDTSNVFSILDGISPEITVLTPDNDFAIPEYMPLTVTWTASDNIAMDSIQITYSNKADGTQQVMGKVPADSSQFIFDIPAGVTDQAMVSLQGWDTSGNDTLVHSPYFKVTDNTPPEVALLTQLQGSEFAIGSMIQIEWIATDNVEVTTIDLLYSTDLSGWKSIFVGEENDGEYQWLIPNDPSDQCQLKVVAHDAIGIAETISGYPFSIVIEYPYLASAPSIISQRDSIWLHFTQAIDTDKFPDGISINSNVIENPEVQYKFDDNNRSVALYCENTFVSADTLLIVLAADQVTNVFGYGLDGNHSSTFEGAPVDNDTVEVIVRYSADFDANDQINWDDLVILSDAWYSRDYRYELGPVIGDPPHFQIASDSLFNIEDAMTFGRMWNWQASLGKRIITMPQTFVGSDIITEQIGNTIVVHSSPVSGKRVVVQYDSERITVSKKEMPLSKPSEMTFNLYA
ncbi:fibronectin type III domain-containing protein, partial [bacterium]|nr:fibronectin type III domain-containing protein [bacterium]